MLTDVRTIVWKEWRELLRMGGSKRSSIWKLLFSIGLLGVLWPWQFGAPFVVSKLTIVFAAFAAAMFVAGVVPDSFAGERERHTLETLLASRLSDRAIMFGKLVALISYGLSAAAVLLMFGWVTVNLMHARATLLFYPIDNLVAAVAFSVIAAALMGAAGVVVSLRSPTVKQAQQVLSTATMLLLFLPIIVISSVPAEYRMRFSALGDEWGGWKLPIVIGAFLIGLAIILYAVAIARFKRAKLILES